MKIWTVGRQDLTSGYSANEWGVGVNRCHVGVQYLGEGVVSWTDVVGVKGWCQGVRDAKESVSCEVGCEMVSRRSGCRSRSSLNGGCAYKACRHETSPCPGVGEIPVEAVVSPVVPVVEASFNWCPVLPVNGLLEQDQSPCGRDSIVVCSSRL